MVMTIPCFRDLDFWLNTRSTLITLCILTINTVYFVGNHTAIGLKGLRPE